jgi:hypothetical protein
MIDGLRLTISGEELRGLLDERIEDHERWRRTLEREQASHAGGANRGTNRSSRRTCASTKRSVTSGARTFLGFIRDHIEAAEAYRLSEADLLFGELLPAKPWAIEQEEFEERTRVGFQLERLTRKVGEICPRELAIAAAREASQT